MPSTPLWLENIGPQYNAREFRRLLKTLCEDVGGVCRQGDLKVAQRAAGANMSVDVAAGDAYIIGTQQPSTQGAYSAGYDAVTNVPIAAANGSNPRRTIVGIRIQDSEYSGSVDSLGTDIVAIDGAPAASPADPALPANFLSLARVLVPTSASSIVNANVTDLRQLAPPAKNARGRLNFNVFGTDTGLIDNSGQFPITNSGTTFSVDAVGRRIRAVADLDVRSSQLDDAITLHFQLDGANIGWPKNTPPIRIPAQDIGFVMDVDFSPAAGSHTVSLTAIRISGSGLARVQSTSSISIYDEGGRIA